MDTHFKAATAILTATALAGVWLFLAPFLLEYQTIGADWITATTHHVTTGAILAATSLTALLGSWALVLRTTRAAAAREPAEPGEPHLS